MCVLLLFYLECRLPSLSSATGRSPGIHLPSTRDESSMQSKVQDIRQSSKATQSITLEKEHVCSLALPCADECYIFVMNIICVSDQL